MAIARPLWARPHTHKAIYNLFGIYFGFYNAHIGEVAVLLVVVKAIAHNEFIRHDKAGVVRLDVHLTALGLVKEGGNSDGIYLSLTKHVGQIGKSSPESRISSTIRTS